MYMYVYIYIFFFTEIPYMALSSAHHHISVARINSLTNKISHKKPVGEGSSPS